MQCTEHLRCWNQSWLINQMIVVSLQNRSVKGIWLWNDFDSR